MIPRSSLLDIEAIAAGLRVGDRESALMAAILYAVVGCGYAGGNDLEIFANEIERMTRDFVARYDLEENAGRN